MRRTPIARVLPLLLAAFAAGCESNPLEPEDVAAEYVLERMGGEPLPVVTYEDGSVSFTLLADTLRLQAEGLGTEVRVIRTDWADPTRSDAVVTTPSPLGYRLRGRRIEIGFGCPLLASAGPPERGAPSSRKSVGGDAALPTTCVPGPHLIGRLDGDALLLYDGRTELRYRRLDP